jgi:hypothetical protein
MGGEVSDWRLLINLQLFNPKWGLTLQGIYYILPQLFKGRVHLHIS